MKIERKSPCILPHIESAILLTLVQSTESFHFLVGKREVGNLELGKNCLRFQKKTPLLRNPPGNWTQSVLDWYS